MCRGWVCRPYGQFAKRTDSRGTGGERLAVHVARDDGLTGTSPRVLAHRRALVESLGRAGTRSPATTRRRRSWRSPGRSTPPRSPSAPPAGSRLKGLFSRGTGESINEGSGDDIDVYVVTHSEAAHGHLLHRRRPPGSDG
ncbi:hypothetical protein [Kitasatospora sp. A2-31]|uniref:hypothetical protein n=1 Tax=Kitasatospora sp. A2-31 TaxID=2916414 RepID=UPI001EEA0FD6|nr:hypothetical protein [Kitasatospora sp. A2-31]MCG6493922.1 hypothetical protein [Kitasatospora sp. A2-31]